MGKIGVKINPYIYIRKCHKYVFSQKWSISTFEGTNRRRMIPGVRIWSQNFFLSTCWIFKIFDFGVDWLHIYT